jgi:hypothetical protein
MKSFWKILIASLLPTLCIIGEMKKNEDANNTGRDAVEGATFTFAADLLEALATGKQLPKAPDALK